MAAIHGNASPHESSFNRRSIAAFVRRKFGDELLDRIVAPFVSGIYAGDPEKLSLRASFPKLHEFEMKYGSVLRGAMKSRPAKGTPRPGFAHFEEEWKLCRARLPPGWAMRYSVNRLR